MSTIALIFLAVTSLALLLVPRRWAPVPLLVGTCYMTLAQVVLVGPFHFPVLRILVACGVVRVLLRGERLSKGTNRLDWAILLSGVAAMATSGFHTDPAFSFGWVYNTWGIYFLLRVMCQSVDDAVFLVQVTALLLAPVAIEMVIESITHHNVFSVLGGVPAIPAIREGRLRAQGPFAHSILAGTVGAVCFPLMIGLWRIHRGTAFIGLLACVTMAITSASSGPVASVFAAIIGFSLWKYREHMKVVRRLALLLYAALDVVMKAPPYFLMARVDFAGGSGGWHRAQLISSAFQHLNEWWLWGTDYTRHWMATGVSWSPNHTDITNHYLELGVMGGLPLMLVFIWSLARAYAFVGGMVRHAVLPDEYRFMIWSFGVGLFAHTATCLSISYFDQSFLFLYVNLAIIGSAYPSLVPARVAAGTEVAEVTQLTATVPMRSVARVASRATPVRASAQVRGARR